MRRQNLNDYLFQISLNSLHQQILIKQVQIDKLQLNLIHGCEGKIQSILSHSQIIKNCHQTIIGLNDVIKHIQNKIIQLQLPEIFTFFQPIYRILVYSVKLISQCYLYRFQTNINNRQIALNSAIIKQKQQQNSHKYTQTRCLTDKKQQKLSNPIQKQQNESKQLQNQMQRLLKEIQSQKQSIQKINYNIKYQLFQQISNIFQDIYIKIQSISNHYLQSTYCSFNQYHHLIQPQFIQQQIISQFKKNFNNISKQKFHKLFSIIEELFNSKIYKKVNLIKKQDNQLIKSLINQIQSSSKIRSSTYSQNISKLKRSHIKKYNQYEEPQNAQIDEILLSSKSTVRQDIQTLTNENNKLKQSIYHLTQQLKKQKIEHTRKQNQSKQLQKMLKIKYIQFNEHRTELQKTINKIQKQSQNLTTQKKSLQQQIKKISNHIFNKISFNDNQTQTQLTWEFKTFQQLISNQLQHKLSNHKHRKFNSGTINKFYNKKTQNFQLILKNALEHLNQITNKQAIQDRAQIQSLIAEGKYEQSLNTLKQKLFLYQTTQPTTKTQITNSPQPQQIQSKKSRYKPIKLRKLKSMDQFITYINISTQTTQINYNQLTYNNKQNYHSTNVQYLNKTNSIKQKRKSKIHHHNSKFTRNAFRKTQHYSPTHLPLTSRYRQIKQNSKKQHNQNNNIQFQKNTYTQHLQKQRIEKLNINLNNNNNFRRSLDLAMQPYYHHKTNTNFILNKKSSKIILEIQDQQNYTQSDRVSNKATKQNIQNNNTEVANKPKNKTQQPLSQKNSSHTHQKNLKSHAAKDKNENKKNKMSSIMTRVLSASPSI